MQLVGNGKHHTKCVPVCVYSEMLAVSTTIARSIVDLADLLPWKHTLDVACPRGSARTHTCMHRAHNVQKA